MSDYSAFRRGGTTYPLPTATTNSLLQDSDPVLFALLDFFSYCLNTYIAPRLLAQSTAVGGKVQLAYTTGLAFNTAVPYDPAPYLQENQGLQPPLFAVWRQKESLKGRTTVWRESVTTFGASYILPPMNAAQAENLLPILNAVSQVLDDRTDLGFDPGYTPPGGALGASPWAMFGVDYIFFQEGAWGHYTIPSVSTNIVFPSWTGTFEVHERTKLVPSGFSTLLGVDITENLQPSDGSAPLTQAQFAVPNRATQPTIAAVTPSTSPIAGGGLVVLSGSFFEAGCAVSIGGAACTAVKAMSSSTVWATTPALAAGSYAIALTNPDGSSVTLPAAITFS